MPQFLFRFPQLNWISFRIMQAGKSPVWILLRIDGDFNPGGPKLLHHGGEVSHAKIDHPMLALISEILAVLRKRGKDSRSRLLRPGFLAVIDWRKSNAQMFLIPLSRGCRILGAEEYTADSSYTLHTNL